MNKIFFLFTFISTAAFSQMSVNNSLEKSGVPETQICYGLLLLDQVPNRVNALFSDADCDACGAQNPVQVVAENFQLTTTRYISELAIHVGYYPADMPLDTDEWTVTFHNNTLNQPDDVIYTESDVASTRFATGETLFGVDEYRVNLTLESDLELDAGIYWVEIHNNSVESTESVFWVSGYSHINSRGGVAYSDAYPATSWSIDTVSTHMSLQLCDLVSDIIYLDGFEVPIVF